MAMMAQAYDEEFGFSVGITPDGGNLMQIALRFRCLRIPSAESEPCRATFSWPPGEARATSGPL